MKKMKRIFVTCKEIYSPDNLNSNKYSSQTENSKVVIFNEEDNEFNLNYLKNVIAQKFNKPIVDCIYLRNGVKVENTNEIKEDDVVYIIYEYTNKDGQSEVNNNNIGSNLRREEWVNLNVGGTLFTTTKTTLTSREPDSFFSKMFSKENCSYWTHRKANDGAILIDRSAHYFGVVLDYFRHGKLIVDYNVNLNGVLEEAKFYLCQNLIELIENELKEREHIKAEENQNLAENLSKALAKTANLSSNDFKLDRKNVIQSLMQTKSDVYLRFQSVNLQGADLSRLDLSWINFRYAILSSTNLSGSNLSFSCFERADMSKANLENAKCHGVRMSCVNLEGANLSGVDFEDPGGKLSNLEGANLKNVNARMCNMNSVILRVATLKNADFTGSSLKRSQLAGADLENCIMNGCDLTEANLRGANFIGTAFNDVQNALHMSQVGIIR
jgi:BTB/POZ domain-containing protein KCTD9